MTTKRTQTKKSEQTVAAAARRVHTRTTGYVSVPRGEYERLLLTIKMLQSDQRHPRPLSAFWTPKTFDELAKEQGVAPLKDWKQIAGGWPRDADFEKFLADIRASRAE